MQCRLILDFRTASEQLQTAHCNKIKRRHADSQSCRGSWEAACVSPCTTGSQTPGRRPACDERDAGTAYGSLQALLCLDWLTVMAVGLCQPTGLKYIHIHTISKLLQDDILGTHCIGLYGVLGVSEWAEFYNKCRNTTEVITRARINAEADDLSHRNHTVSRHISVRSYHWWSGKTSMRL